jgi:hypothetical protein
VSLIFSSYYLSNAASAFGHSLMRLNKPSGPSQERRELLDIGVNYSATVDTTNAVLYAFKGMFGLFAGRFQRMPYYYKVREYNDYESRDLWEYELDVRGPRLARLVDHLWELGSTYFDYFYLTENCSYHLLAALEVADPRLELLDQLGWPVIPADTIKAVVRVSGLVRQVRYRPALRTQFQARVRGLGDAARRLVDRLPDEPAAPFPAGMSRQEAARVIDAAMDLVDMRYGEDIVGRPSSLTAARRLALLGRRARLGVTSEVLAVPRPANKAPDASHGSARVGLGSGATSSGDAFASLRFRLALHDLGDPPAGYPDLSQLEFLPGELRIDAARGEVGLDRLSLVTVRNLVPMNRFEHRPSWQLDLATRRLGDECDGCLAATLDFAAGGALATDGARLAAFAMVATRVGAGPRLDGPMGAVRAGVGGTGGVRAVLAPDLVALVEGDWLVFPRQPRPHQLELRGGLRWQYFPALALELGTRIRDDAGEASLAWLAYY